MPKTPKMAVLGVLRDPKKGTFGNQNFSILGTLKCQKCLFLVLVPLKRPAMQEKKKIISLIGYVSLPIVTANFDEGGVFFLF